ncbi:hypothetical protein C8R46DRAFT_238745 [Mycena filopes]|nr:hypothetical protein C8R46DRAFT_238745 [Mycena filopes]
MALLCLDHCFTNAPNSEGLPADGLKQRLEAFRAYKRLLRKFAFEIDPCSSDATEKVFGFRRVAGGTRRYSMRPGTFIPMHSFSNKNVVAGPELRTLFRKALEARLYERVPMEFEPVLVALPPSRPPTPCQPPVSEIKATEDAKDEVLPRDGKDQDKGEYENEVVSGDPEDKRQDEGARKDLDLDDPPLRHLLLCLELVMTRAYDEKRTVQKEIGSAVTEALEQAKERFEELQ